MKQGYYTVNKKNTVLVLNKTSNKLSSKMYETLHLVTCLARGKLVTFSQAYGLTFPAIFTMQKQSRTRHAPHSCVTYSTLSVTIVANHLTSNLSVERHVTRRNACFMQCESPFPRKLRKVHGKLHRE